MGNSIEIMRILIKRILAPANSGEKVDFSKNPQKHRFLGIFRLSNFTIGQKTLLKSLKISNQSFQLDLESFHCRFQEN